MMRPVCDFDHILVLEEYTTCPLISLSACIVLPRVGFSRERFKKDNIPLVHKSLPHHREGFYVIASKGGRLLCRYPECR
jgi:hypothetical protein